MCLLYLVLLGKFIYIGDIDDDEWLIIVEYFIIFKIVLSDFKGGWGGIIYLILNINGLVVI